MVEFKLYFELGLSLLQAWAFNISLHEDTGEYESASHMWQSDN